MDEKELYTAMTAVLEEEEEEMISLSEFFDIDVGISEYSDNGAEEEESEGSLFSIEISQCYCDHDDRVFVAVGKSESSMHAILWTLKHAITPSSTVVHLIHVFPEIRFIPSPCKFS